MKQEENMEKIQIEKIKVGENVRKDYGDLTELTASIKEHGVRKPIELTTSNLLVDGYRRLKAAKAAGLSEIPYFYWDGKIDTTTSQILAGIFQKNLNPIEEGKAFRKYIDGTKILIPNLAKKISKPLIYVEKRLILEKLSKEIQENLISNKILLGHAIILSKFPEKEGIKLMKQIINQKIGVESLREHIKYRCSEQISEALFDKKECKTCKYNGSCQSELFETGKVLNGNCMNPGCFMKKKSELVKRLKIEYKDVLFKGENEWSIPNGFDIVGRNMRITKPYVKECRKKRENYLVIISEHGEVIEYFRIPPKKAEKVESKTGEKEKSEPRNSNSLNEFKVKFLIEKSTELMKPGTKEAKVLTLIRLYQAANWNIVDDAKKQFNALIPGLMSGDYGNQLKISKIYKAKEK